MHSSFDTVQKGLLKISFILQAEMSLFLQIHDENVEYGKKICFFRGTGKKGFF